MSGSTPKPGRRQRSSRFCARACRSWRRRLATIAWFGVRVGPSTFGIFDAFPDEVGRQAHLAGRVEALLMAEAPHLLERPPQIEMLDVIAVKLPT
jgi:hypothetical protein